MNCDKLFEVIENQKDFYLDVWEKISTIESPTDSKEGLDNIVKYFSDMAKARGFMVEICHQDIAGDIACITMNQSSNEQPIVFSGHIDTVHPIGSFGYPPVHKDDKNIYGPGVMDCKGGVVAGFAAMDALNSVGFNKRPIKLIIQTDEEKNSRTSNKETIRYMIEKSKDAIAFLNCESSKGNTLVLWRKGIVQFEFKIKGTSIHSSRCPIGVSAVAEAAHKIIELEKMKDFDGLTCNCGVIQGGTSDNTVPAECYFTADIRFADNEQLEKARKIVKEIAEKSFVGASCTLIERPYRPAMECSSKNDALLKKINQIYNENGLPLAKPRLSLGGSDAAYTTDAGIPTVDSIGVEGDFIHTIDEYATLASLKEATKRIAAIAFCM